MPRISPMADAASRMPTPRSSAASASDTGAAATWVVGIRSAATVPQAYATAATASTPCDRPISVGGGGEEAGRRRGEAGQELELGVGLDQLGVVAHHGGHEGASGYAIGLAHGEDGEGLGEQQEAVEVVEHDQADARPGLR